VAPSAGAAGAECEAVDLGSSGGLYVASLRTRRSASSGNAVRSAGGRELTLEPELLGPAGGERVQLVAKLWVLGQGKEGGAVRVPVAQPVAGVDAGGVDLRTPVAPSCAIVRG
jgi:hypothetical protein